MLRIKTKTYQVELKQICNSEKSNQGNLISNVVGNSIRDYVQELAEQMEEDEIDYNDDRMTALADAAASSGCTIEEYCEEYLGMTLDEYLAEEDN